MSESPSPGKARAGTPPDAVQAMRGATHALHQELDQNLPLARADASLADYAMHLCVLRDWQQGLAPWLRRAGQNDSPLALIAADLADCAASGIHVAEPTVPDLSVLRAADDGSDAFCWGTAYVLEGSRLGGQVLYRRLHAQLAPHPLRYLGGRGADGPGWPQFLATLRGKLASPDDCEAGCKGAIAAFQVLLAQFRQQGALV